MRVGAVQDLLKSSAIMPVIKNKGRWSKIDTVMRYLEGTNQTKTPNSAHPPSKIAVLVDDYAHIGGHED